MHIGILYHQIISTYFKIVCPFVYDCSCDLIYLTRSLQEEYVKDEMRNLKRELIRAKEVRYKIAFYLT